MKFLNKKKLNRELQNKYLIEMLKRIIKLIISLILFILDKLFYLIENILNLERKWNYIVIYYHGIKEKEKNKFKKQMEYILKHYTPIKPDNEKNIKNELKYIGITFDDGLESIIKIAIPELEKRNIPATIFIPTGYIEKEPKWLRYNKNSFYLENVIKLEEIKQINKELFSIGSHSVTHCDLTMISEEEIKEELIKSKLILESILGYKIKLLSFPYGKYNKKVIEIAKEVGYEKTFSTEPKPNFIKDKKFVIGRVKVDPNDWPIEFKLKIEGSYRWLQIGKKIKKILKNKLE